MDFDPSKSFDKLDDGLTPQFDPSKSFDNLDQPQTPEDPHDASSFLKTVGSGALQLGKQAIGGAINAALHPIQTAEDVGNSVLGADTEGAYRVVRNAPIIGPVIDKAVEAAQGIPAYLKGGDDAALQAVNAQDDWRNQIQMEDQKHQQEHPLTDFIQRSVGSLAVPGGPEARIATLGADALTRSIAQGNSAGDVLKDARNAALLGGLAQAGGIGFSKVGDKAAAAAPAISEKVAGYVVPKAGLALGASIGAPLGYTGAAIGAKLGEETGQLALKYGTTAVKAVTDAGLKLHAVVSNPAIEGVIMKAAQESPKSLAIAHYLLSQSNPEYQSLSSSP